MTAFPVRRLRRLRQSPALRRLVAEHDLTPRRLVLPVFVKEGIDAAQPIASMPGVAQHPLDAVPALVEEAVAAGIGGIMLFGVPADRDAVGSGATDPDGILNRAIAAAATAAAGRLTVQADLCLDEFTDHGHCGVLAADGSVDNDATLDVYARMAVAQAEAGADVLGLSGMMDGQVAACRAALDAGAAAARRTGCVISRREIGRPEEDTQRLIGGFQPPPPAPMPPADPASSEALLTLLASVRQGMTAGEVAAHFAWPLDKARQALEQLFSAGTLRKRSSRYRLKNP